VELSRALPKAKFLVTLRASNFSGSTDLGGSPGLLPGRTRLEDASPALRQKWVVLPSQVGRGVKEMFKGALQGELDLLFVIGSDPRQDFIDTELAGAALDRVGFVVSVDTFLSATSERADLVLPAAAFAEKSGTTTNLEGRVFTLNQKVTPPGVCRSDWTIASEIALELGEDLGFGSPAEILDEIAEVSLIHWGLSFDRLTRTATVDGMVVPISATALAIRPRALLDQVSTPGIASVWNQGLASSKTAYVEGEESEEAREVTGTPQSLSTKVLGAPIWPLASVQPTGNLALEYSRKLYSQGEHLKNSPHLSRLIVEAKCRVSPRTAKELGVETGGFVRISDKAGGGAVFEVETDDSVRNGAVEIVRGSFFISGFSPVRADETVNYVKVERA
ncbi:MAG: molybdopterin-dependent oxidoreductase, partial [Actinomycetota bacterium]|nr:molybdopterin-dependent oxidoreductase [Actinomycetota bacterium]